MMNSNIFILGLSDLFLYRIKREEKAQQWPWGPYLSVADFPSLDSFPSLTEMGRFHLVGSGLLSISLFSESFSCETFSEFWPMNFMHFILCTLFSPQVPKEADI